MPELVTNHMLRKQLARMSRETRNGVVGISSNTSTDGDTPVPVTLTEKTIDRVQLDEFIAEDGTRGKLYNPIPGVYWSCTTTPSPNGLTHLNNKLKGLFLSDGSNTYLLGVSGDTSEFEILIKSGENEIRLNEFFLSLKAGMYVANGVEAELGNNNGE